MKNNRRFLFFTTIFIILMLSGCRPIQDIGRSRSDCIKKYEKKYCDDHELTFEKYSMQGDYATETDVHQEILNLFLWEEDSRNQVDTQLDPSLELWDSVDFLDITTDELDTILDYLDERKEQDYEKLESLTNDYLEQILKKATVLSEEEREKLYDSYKDINKDRVYSDSAILLYMYTKSKDEYGDITVISNTDVTKKKNKDGTYTYTASIPTKTMTLLFPDYMEKAATASIRDNLCFEKGSDLDDFIDDFNQSVDYLSYMGREGKHSEEIAACKKSIKKNRELINKGYYKSDEYKRAKERLEEKYSNSVTKNSSSTSSSNRSKSKEVDPSDYDIEAYYDDYSDIYDNYDDAEEGFLDEDSETQEFYR